MCPIFHLALQSKSHFVLKQQMLQTCMHNYCSIIFLLIHVGTITMCELCVKVTFTVIKQLKNCKDSLQKKIRASTGIEPMTSAIPVQCSTTGYEALWEIWFWYNDQLVYIWTADIVCQWKWPSQLWSSLQINIALKNQLASCIWFPLKPWFFFRAYLCSCLGISS